MFWCCVMHGAPYQDIHYARCTVFTTNERSSINLYLLTQIREIVMQQTERKKVVVDWDDVDERPIQ